MPFGSARTAAHGTPGSIQARYRRGAHSYRGARSFPEEVVPPSESLLRIPLAGMGVQQLCQGSVPEIRRHPPERNASVRSPGELHLQGVAHLRLDREQSPGIREQHFQGPAIRELVQQPDRFLGPQGPVPHRGDDRRRNPHHPDSPDFLQTGLQRHAVGLSHRQLRADADRIAGQLARHPRSGHYPAGDDRGELDARGGRPGIRPARRLRPGRGDLGFGAPRGQRARDWARIP